MWCEIYSQIIFVYALQTVCENSTMWEARHKDFVVERTGCGLGGMVDYPFPPEWAD